MHEEGTAKIFPQRSKLDIRKCGFDMSIVQA